MRGTCSGSSTSAHALRPSLWRTATDFGDGVSTRPHRRRPPAGRTTSPPERYPVARNLPGVQIEIVVVHGLVRIHAFDFGIPELAHEWNRCCVASPFRIEFFKSNDDSDKRSRLRPGCALPVDVTQPSGAR